MTYQELYDLWVARQQPSATTARMTRKSLKYVAGVTGNAAWEGTKVLPLQHALVVLDAAMADKDLRPQSRSNYRNYLRNLYKVLAAEGIDIDGDAGERFWPASPEQPSRRAQVAYERFVKWAIGRAIWPLTVKAGDFLHWARDEKAKVNRHWRKDYVRLEETWTALVAASELKAITFSPLPRKLNEAYAIPVDHWPPHLRTEWERVCDEASAPLRKGGMRPWREVTRRQNERRLAQLLGWYQVENPKDDLGSLTWAPLLSAENCQGYINWLVARNGKRVLNPSHTAFLRMVRGLHRFLLGSEKSTIDQFHELAKRCEVEERDKAVRMVPYSQLEVGLHKMFDEVRTAMKAGSRDRRQRLAILQVDAIILGLLVTRALRSANIIGIRVETNLVVTDVGYQLRFDAGEMKGHRKFETTIAADLVPFLQDYLRTSYRVLSGRSPAAGDPLLLNREGQPLNRGAFVARVARLSRRLLGKAVNPHLFRHIVATHAAQVWKLTPTELAAFLAHRSPLTCMKYYEVTNPTLAAARVDKFRAEAGAQTSS